MLIGRDLVDFSITSWYENFKETALKTIIIPLPPEIRRLLLTYESRVMELFEQEPSDQFSLEPETEGAIHAFCAAIKNALKLLNNKAFVKNNWHAAIDAKMFSMNNLLLVTNMEECLQYVIMSSKIMNSFIPNGVPYCFAFKPWINIHPATEFRCIVINRILRGITPRDWPAYYAHYKEEGPNIITLVNAFFCKNIKCKFPRESYTFDIILQYPSKNIYLLDFGPLNKDTNLYAFSTKEVLRLQIKDSSDEIAPVFRYLDSDIGIMTRAAALQKINFQ